MNQFKRTVSALAAATAVLAQAQVVPGERVAPWGFDVSGQDWRARPGDDFFQWANGAWAERTLVPPDQSSYGNSAALRELSEQRVHDLLQQLSTEGRPANANAAKLAAAWRSFMDEERIETLDAVPLAPMLEAVRATRSHRDMAALMGKSGAGDYKSFFSFSVWDDAKDPKQYAVYLGTDGLGLPDRDYYLLESFASKKAAYQDYVAQLLGLLQWHEPAAAARAIVEMEVRIAKATWSRAQRRDRDKTHVPKTMVELQALAPGLDWEAFLNAAQLSRAPKLVLTSDSAFPALAAIYRETPLETLQAWQAFSIADAAAPLLSKRFARAHFAFRSGVLAGQAEERARWKRAVAFANSALGEAVGQLYVQRYFPPVSKAAILDLVGNVRLALRQRIEQLVWMGPETKRQALAKLEQLGVKIGYPEVWRDYTALHIDASDLFGNSQRAQAFEWQRKVLRLGQPVDPREWYMTPQTVNAYYSSTKNEIVFPAAILQPPYFDLNADPAINYGAIGGVIGHEISHGFDDQGRKSDGTGLLRDWWTAEDAAKFKAQADRLGKQYDAIEPLPGVHVNGALTMGENIGDLGGLLIALDAYRMATQGKQAPRLDGTTGEQRVFLGWAQVWRAKHREDYLRRLLVSDTHSPAVARVNGVVRNIDAWYEAFDIRPGDKLYLPPDERVRIW